MKKFWKKENEEIETKPIAENPQYNSEMEKDMENKEEKIKNKKFFLWIAANKKKVACIAVACVFGLTALGYGGYQAIVSDADSSNTAKEKTVTIVDEKTGEEKVVDADSEAAKEAKAEGNVIKSSNSEKATKATSSNKSASSNKSSSSSNKGTSSSGGSSANKPTTHTHSWVAQYSTRTVTKYRTETIEIRKCSDCGMENPSSSHLESELLNGGSGGWYSSTKTQSVPYQTTEKYVSGYRCSCGATK